MQNKRRHKYKLIMAATMLGGIFIFLSALAEKKREPKSIDNGNPYLKDAKKSKELNRKPEGFYGKYGKRILDKGISFLGLVILAPLYGIISLAVYLDDPGPVIFTQKRVGLGKHFIEVHKFRSMKMSTPHDIPTHQLKNPEEYITRVGSFLRKSSLDELPQVWDIFRGKMSIIGPRPALWNQDDLVAEREKYGANDVMPGLTGWAQINGRDELEIPDKAKLDGEYTKVLRQGGRKAFLQDLCCFAGTVGSVLKKDGVVEGGTGTIRKIEVPTADEAGFEDYGHLKNFSIDKGRKVKVLITGAGSYIGESFRTYCEEHYPNIACSTVDMIDGAWREQNFSGYDCIFHVAGIAHADVGKVSEKAQENYYKVNTDLAIECCRKAKHEGVKQFVFMSSMIIYGGREYIDDKTIPAPDNFYGNSKWLADKGVRELADDHFHVAVLRPPMIYGRGSKGNYPTLAKLARKLPVFPDVDNKRSMLYIENLCEFAALLMLSGEGGIYFPQNKEYTKTSEMVREIGSIAGRQVKVTKLLVPAVRVVSHVPGKISGLADKAFGNSWYDQKLSLYNGFDYRTVSRWESVMRTEGIDTGIIKKNFIRRIRVKNISS